MSSIRKPLLSADRVRVYLTLVPYLLERGEVSVSEAAADFDVTPTQMRQMVHMLTLIGLPGESGHWQQPHELFDINWSLLENEDIIEITNDVALHRVPRLTSREAAALLAGLKMTTALPQIADSQLVAGLMSKLARGASGVPAEVLIVPTTVSDVHTTVSTALENRVAVSFRYQAPDAAASTRTVDPFQIIVNDGQWYLQGWCHLRKAVRTFHLDRVTDARVTTIPVTHQAGSDAEEAPVERSIVHIRVSRTWAVLMSDQFSMVDQQADGDHVIVSMQLSDPSAVRRWVSRWGDEAEVLSPGQARRATYEWARDALALYSEIPGHRSVRL
ncbi:helix-turn-helix transcriptional regulator [Microbacterium sp. YY-01]|uniref:helix-turn-helix transcriptional regulator n=1 Tax=Microbacterium sp. YY-01 TaxID=3421634 RepID=UPI003D177758